MADLVTEVRAALPAGLTARALTLDDVDLYLSLTARAADFFETYDGGMPSREALLADMTALPPGTSPDAKTLVGTFRGDELVAYLDVVAGYADGHTWYIGLLLIAATERGQHLGTALAGATGRAAACAGATRLMMGVYDANAPARAFWTRCGFSPDGHVPDYVNRGGQIQPVTRFAKALIPPGAPASTSESGCRT